MKYSSHGNDPLLAIERYTHSMSSAYDPNSSSPETINVSITCSRVPQNGWQISDLSTLKSSLTTAALSPPAKIWRGAFKANSQFSREKEQDLQKTSVSTHPQAMARPVSRVSVREESVYSANGIVKTDNHRRSTSLPQQPLVQPTGTGLKQVGKTTQHTHNTTDPSAANKQQENNTMPPSTQQTEEGELKPSESLRIYLSSHVGPSIAPAGVRAVATQRLRPVTSNTIIKGRGLVTAAR